MSKLGKVKEFFGLENYDEDDEDMYYDEYSNKDNKVLSLHSNKNIKIASHEPISYDDAPYIIDDLKLRKAVIVNFEQLDNALKRQIFEFVNGAVYALEGKAGKISKDVFVFAPSNAEIEGVKDEILKKGMYSWDK